MGHRVNVNTKRRHLNLFPTKAFTSANPFSKTKASSMTESRQHCILDSNIFNKKNSNCIKTLKVKNNIGNKMAKKIFKRIL